MTVTMGYPVWLSGNMVRLSWSSDLSDPRYYVYLDGELLATMTGTVLDLPIVAGASPVIDVFDSADDQPEYVRSGRATLCWWPAAGAESYRIEEYVGAAWTTRATLQADGAGFFSWMSRVLEDVTTHAFRVVAIDGAGNDGESTAFSVLIVRHPDVPAVSYSYDSDTGMVTVSGA